MIAKNQGINNSSNMKKKIPDTKNFTIIIPCISFKDVKDCIKKIRKIYTKIKIIVCLNKKSPIRKKEKNLKFILSKTDSIAEKRNIAVNACKTKYLAFLDSDAFPDKNWIESAFKLLKKKKNCIIAGPHIDPPNQNSSEKLVGAVKKSFLITMKPKLQKYNSEKEQYVSFLPSVNWVLTKKLFNSMNQMDSKMIRNEDWDFVYRMRKKNYKLFYSPNTLVFHENGTISHFIKKRFKYGFHMWPILVQLNYENYYFFTPLIFTIFLLSFPFCFLSDHYSFLFLSVLILYLSIIITESIRIADSFFNFFKILFILLFANISPGFGIFLGFFKFFFKK